jgi:hypothetical protein
MIDDRDLGKFTVSRLEEGSSACGQGAGRAPRRARASAAIRNATPHRPLPAQPHPPLPPSSRNQSWLGFAIMILLVAYHYVTADPKFAEQQKQQ